MWNVRMECASALPRAADTVLVKPRPAQEDGGGELAEGREEEAVHSMVLHLWEGLP